MGRVMGRRTGKEKIITLCVCVLVGLQAARSLGSAGAKPSGQAQGAASTTACTGHASQATTTMQPISESGDYGQPGIGGPNKFDVRCPQ